MKKTIKIISIFNVIFWTRIFLPIAAFAQNTGAAKKLIGDASSSFATLATDLKKLTLTVFIIFVAVYAVVKGVQMINGDPQAKDSLIKTGIVAVVVFIIVELLLTGITALAGA